LELIALQLVEPADSSLPAARLRLRARVTLLLLKQRRRRKARAILIAGVTRRMLLQPARVLDAMSADEAGASTDDEGKKEEAFGDMLAHAGPSDTELSDSGEKPVFTEQKSELV
jgi:hypothetical protein